MKNLFLFLLLCSSAFVQAQVNEFPNTWMGEWSGILFIEAGGKKDSVSMELVIAPTDTMGVFQWTTTYNKTDVRNYVLKAVDKSKGHYMIDELSGIQLDCFLRSNSLFSRYDVAGNYIEMNLHKIDQELLFTCSSGPLKNIRTTQAVEDGQVFGANAYPVVVGQIARLRKKSKHKYK
jgi:hypothetical protein